LYLDIYKRIILARKGKDKEESNKKLIRITQNAAFRPADFVAGVPEKNRNLKTNRRITLGIKTLAIRTTFKSLKDRPT